MLTYDEIEHFDERKSSYLRDEPASPPRPRRRKAAVTPAAVHAVVQVGATELPIPLDPAGPAQLPRGENLAPVGVEASLLPRESAAPVMLVETAAADLAAEVLPATSSPVVSMPEAAVAAPLASPPVVSTAAPLLPPAPPPAEAVASRPGFWRRLLGALLRRVGRGGAAL